MSSHSPEAGGGLVLVGSEGSSTLVEDAPHEPEPETTNLVRDPAPKTSANVRSQEPSVIYYIEGCRKRIVKGAAGGSNVVHMRSRGRVEKRADYEAYQEREKWRQAVNVRGRPSEKRDSTRNDVRLCGNDDEGRGAEPHCPPCSSALQSSPAPTAQPSARTQSLLNSIERIKVDFPKSSQPPRSTDTNGEDLSMGRRRAARKKDQASKKSLDANEGQNVQDGSDAERRDRRPKKAKRRHERCVLKVNDTAPSSSIPHFSPSRSNTRQHKAHNKAHLPDKQSDDWPSLPTMNIMRGRSIHSRGASQHKGRAESTADSSHFPVFTVHNAGPRSKSRGYQPSEHSASHPATPLHTSNTIPSPQSINTTTIAVTASTAITPNTAVCSAIVKQFDPMALNPASMASKNISPETDDGEHIVLAQVKAHHANSRVLIVSQSDGAEDAESSMEIIVDDTKPSHRAGKSITCWSKAGDVDHNVGSFLESLRDPEPSWNTIKEKSYPVQRTNAPDFAQLKYQHPDDNKPRPSSPKESFDRQRAVLAPKPAAKPKTTAIGTDKKPFTDGDFPQLKANPPLKDTTNLPRLAENNGSGITKGKAETVSTSQVAPPASKLAAAETVTLAAKRASYPDLNDAPKSVKSHKSSHSGGSKESDAATRLFKDFMKKRDLGFSSKLSKPAASTMKAHEAESDVQAAVETSEIATVVNESVNSVLAPAPQLVSIKQHHQEENDIISTSQHHPHGKTTSDLSPRTKERLTSDMKKNLFATDVVTGLDVSARQVAENVDLTKSLDVKKKEKSTTATEPKLRGRGTSQYKEAPIHQTEHEHNDITEKRHGKQARTHPQHDSGSKMTQSPQSQTNSGIPMPIGDSWNTRPAYNTKERKVVVQAYAAEVAGSVRDSVDMNSEEFRNGLPVLDTEVGEDQVLLEKSSKTSSKKRSSKPSRALNTTEQNVKQHEEKKKSPPNPNIDLLRDPRKMTKEQYQDMVERQRELASKPRTWAPKANIYLRPAEPTDAKGIADIANWHIKNTMVPLIDTDDASYWREQIAAEAEASNPFIVAILKKGKGKKSRHEKGEFIVGFGRAMDFGSPFNAYRFTLELEIFVHEDYFHQGIGKNLFDRLMMSLVNRPYVGKSGVDFVADNEDRYISGFHRNTKTIIVSIYYSNDDDTLGWKTAFLIDQNFEQFARLQNAGFKHGKA